MLTAPALRRVALLGAALAPLLAACDAPETGASAWTDDERRLIASLSLDALPAPPPVPSNRVADDPRAAALGRALFFDARLSADGAVSCATCHLPDRQFQDDRPVARGIGTTDRRTMPLAGVAYAPWLFWDGRKDSLWSQALGPLESPVEHGTDRTAVVRHVAEFYRLPFEALFGPLPDTESLPAQAAPAGTLEAVDAWAAMSPQEREAVDRAFAGVGKAIEAYERTLAPAPTRFDRFAAALAGGGDPANILTAQEEDGLRLFLGRGACVDCHNGPLLTDQHFHNTGVPAAPGLPDDPGRIAGAALMRVDPFNCLGRHSDAPPIACAELRFMAEAGEDMLRAFKPPSLRGVASRPPYMHAGQIGTLRDVIDHYNQADEAPAGHSELEPLGLSPAEREALVAFLGTLEPERQRVATSR